MMHDEAVQCMAVSHDSELLATGARNGKIKVWRVATGKCVRKFLRAHEKGVSSVQFNSDASQVLSASVDTTARYALMWEAYRRGSSCCAARAILCMTRDLGCLACGVQGPWPDIWQDAEGVPRSRLVCELRVIHWNWPSHPDRLKRRYHEGNALDHTLSCPSLSPRNASRVHTARGCVRATAVGRQVD